MAAERHLRVQQLVDAYLREGADLPTYLLKVEADLRDEVAAQCREATFAAQFFQELPPLRLLQAPPEVVGDCRLGEALGEGAMGQVFRARQARLDRDVAVKLIRPEHADRADFLSRFRDEAKPEWARHLRWVGRGAFKQGLRYLMETGDSSFKPVRLR